MSEAHAAAAEIYNQFAGPGVGCAANSALPKTSRNCSAAAVVMRKLPTASIWFSVLVFETASPTISASVTEARLRNPAVGTASKYMTGNEQALHMDEFGCLRGLAHGGASLVYAWSSYRARAACLVSTRTTAPRPPAAHPLRRPRNTPIWKFEAALKFRSCRKGRYAPPVHMIKLTETREITPLRLGCIFSGAPTERTQPGTRLASVHGKRGG